MKIKQCFQKHNFWQQSNLFFFFFWVSECPSYGRFRWLESRRVFVTRIYRFLHQVLNNITVETRKVTLVLVIRAYAHPCPALLRVLWPKSFDPWRYEIKFLVDGEWQLSPEFPTVGEGLTKNNLLVVEWSCCGHEYIILLSQYPTFLVKIHTSLKLVLFLFYSISFLNR